MNELDQARARLLDVLYQVARVDIGLKGLAAVIAEIFVGRDYAVEMLKRAAQTMKVGAGRLDGKADLFRPRRGSHG